MHRLTARLLLLFALAGYTLPLAIALSSDPPRACCMRKAHHCDQLSSAETGRVFLDPCRCSDYPRRVASTNIWAHPEEVKSASFSPILETLVENIPFFLRAREAGNAHPSRASPQLSIAQ